MNLLHRDSGFGVTAWRLATKKTALQRLIALVHPLQFFLQCPQRRLSGRRTSDALSVFVRILNRALCLGQISGG